MISLIISVFGTKLGRFIAEIVLAVIAAVAIALHYQSKGEALELAKLQTSSASLVAQAQKRNAQDTAQYAAAQKMNQEKTDEAVAANATLESQLADSVRQYNAYRRAHPAVDHPAGGTGAALPGACGSEDCGEVIVRLAMRGNELAGSVDALGVDLQSCERDRDALTGLPKEY